MTAPISKQGIFKLWRICNGMIDPDRSVLSPSFDSKVLQVKIDEDPSEIKRTKFRAVLCAGQR